jgi:hypothetical protein
VGRHGLRLGRLLGLKVHRLATFHKIDRIPLLHVLKCRSLGVEIHRIRLYQGTSIINSNTIIVIREDVREDASQFLGFQVWRIRYS